MDKKMVLGAIIVLAILGMALHFSGTSSNIAGAGANLTNQSTQSNRTLFSNSPYSQFSYLVSSNALTYQAQAALAGFNLTKTQLANGSTEMKISVIGTNINQTVLLSPGYKEYVVETSFGEDNGNFDGSLADDGFVTVDQNGYVV
ncbi:MAG: hypothetical protein KGH71_00280 [Candidatus Micrarchaeota archaeon]|nr:hypothetical protein [Candidatus Micrarchaeota archaeon]